MDSESKTLSKYLWAIIADKCMSEDKISLSESAVADAWKEGDGITKIIKAMEQKDVFSPDIAGQDDEGSEASLNRRKAVIKACRKLSADLQTVKELGEDGIQLLKPERLIIPLGAFGSARSFYLARILEEIAPGKLVEALELAISELDNPSSNSTSDFLLCCSLFRDKFSSAYYLGIASKVMHEPSYVSVKQILSEVARDYGTVFNNHQDA